MTQIIYKEDIPLNVQTEIDAIVKQFRWLIPTWVHKLFIDVESSHHITPIMLQSGHRLIKNIVLQT